MLVVTTDAESEPYRDSSPAAASARAMHELEILPTSRLSSPMPITDLDSGFLFGEPQPRAPAEFFDPDGPSAFRNARRKSLLRRVDHRPLSRPPRLRRAIWRRRKRAPPQAGPASRNIAKPSPATHTWATRGWNGPKCFGSSDEVEVVKNRAYYSDSIDDFLNRPPDEILGVLVRVEHFHLSERKETRG